MTPNPKILARCLPYTSVGEARLAAWIADVRRVCETGQPGDIIEAGVWRGGCIAAALIVCADYPDHARRVWAFDTFAGMTPPGPEDIDYTGRTAADCLASDPRGSGVWCECPLIDFLANLACAGADASRLEVRKGDILAARFSAGPPLIAALRVDLDWHLLVTRALAMFGPRLHPSAPVHIDDYGHWHGARTAADQWAAANGRRAELIDYTGARLVPTPTPTHPSP